MDPWSQKASNPAMDPWSESTSHTLMDPWSQKPNSPIQDLSPRKSNIPVDPLPDGKRSSLTDPWSQKSHSPVTDSLPQNRSSPHVDPWSQKSSSPVQPLSPRKANSPIMDTLPQKRSSLTDPWSQKSLSPVTDPLPQNRSSPLTDPWSQKSSSPVLDLLPKKATSPVMDPMIENRSSPLMDPWSQNTNSSAIDPSPKIAKSPLVNPWDQNASNSFMDLSHQKTGTHLKDSSRKKAKRQSHQKATPPLTGSSHKTTATPGMKATSPVKSASAQKANNPILDPISQKANTSAMKPLLQKASDIFTGPSLQEASTPRVPLINSTSQKASNLVKSPTAEQTSNPVMNPTPQEVNSPVMDPTPQKASKLAIEPSAQKVNSPVLDHSSQEGSSQNTDSSLKKEINPALNSSPQKADIPAVNLPKKNESTPLSYSEPKKESSPLMDSPNEESNQLTDSSPKKEISSLSDSAIKKESIPLRNSPNEESNQLTDSSPKKESISLIDSAVKKENRPLLDSAPKQESIPLMDSAPKQESSPEVNTTPKKESSPQMNESKRKRSQAMDPSPEKESIPVLTPTPDKENLPAMDISHHNSSSPVLDPSSQEASSTHVMDSSSQEGSTCVMDPSVQENCSPFIGPSVQEADIPLVYPLAQNSTFLAPDLSPQKSTCDLMDSRPQKVSNSFKFSGNPNLAMPTETNSEMNSGFSTPDSASGTSEVSREEENEHDYQTADNLFNYYNLGTEDSQSDYMSEDEVHQSDDFSYLMYVHRSLKAMLQEKHSGMIHQKKIEHERFAQVPWIDFEWDFPFEHYYVGLTVHSKQGVQSKEIQLQDLFKSDGNKRPTRILIEGPMGFGKSMLALKLCYDYSKGENYMKDFETVILLRGREFKESTIDEMLESELKLEDYSFRSILETIKRTQKPVLIILDGYHESDERTRDNLQPVLNGDYLPDVTVIVTTRPGVFSATDVFSKIVELKGVTGAKRWQFIHSHLGTCSEEKSAFIRDFFHSNFDVAIDEETMPTVVSENVSKKLSVLLEKDKCLDCPLFLLLVLAVAKNSYPNTTHFRNKTELYKTLFNFVAQITLSAEASSEEIIDLFDFDIEDPPSYVCSLSRFGQLSLKALIAKQSAFTREEILSHCGSDDAIIFHMGVLLQNHDEYTPCGQKTIWYQPLHLTILEFCAAYHLWCFFKCQPNLFVFPVQFLPNISGNVETYVFPFFVGLCAGSLPFFFTTLLPGQFPKELVQRLARCETMICESALELCALSKALSPLVPEVWHTSYFKADTGTAIALLKATVAEAAWRNRLECIVHDYDFQCDISMGKGHVSVPLIILKTNSAIHSLRQTYSNVSGFELRIFLEACKNGTELLAQVELLEPSIISVIKPTNPNFGKALASLFNSHRFPEVFILCPWMSENMIIVEAKGDSFHAVGKFIGHQTPLYDTMPVLRSKGINVTLKKLSENFGTSHPSL